MLRAEKTWLPYGLSRDVKPKEVLTYFLLMCIAGCASSIPKQTIRLNPVNKASLIDEKAVESFYKDLQGSFEDYLKGSASKKEWELRMDYPEFADSIVTSYNVAQAFEAAVAAAGGRVIDLSRCPGEGTVNYVIELNGEKYDVTIWLSDLRGPSPFPPHVGSAFSPFAPPLTGEDDLGPLQGKTVTLTRVAVY